MGEDEKRAARDHEESIRNQAMYVAGEVTAGYCQGRADGGWAVHGGCPTPERMLEEVYRKALALLKEAIVIP